MCGLQRAGAGWGERATTMGANLRGRNRFSEGTGVDGPYCRRKSYNSTNCTSSESRRMPRI